ncbi:MAG: hypothetical protein CL687_03395 [Candidatus Pelagibacter sp.]|nr:hypothetical protein [Candidatus Pelagibacter sp.]
MIIKKNLFILLLAIMSLVIIVSNFLVQFPVYQFGLENILTYGAFTYPISFLVTDFANRAFGKEIAKRVVYFGFLIGIFLTLVVSTNFSDIISIRIAFGSGIAFLTAQLIDVNIFDRLRRKKSWYIAPLFSSTIGSTIDTFLFFFISFYGTEVPWYTLAFGDLVVKFLIAFLMLIPFRIFITYFKDFSAEKKLV